MGKNSRIIQISKPRKQHVISEMHLRHFCGRDGSLYVYEKGKPIRKSIPRNEAVHRDYFECKVPGYETNFKVEKGLAALENAASATYTKLIEGGPLTFEQMAPWALYVASIFLRSRKVREELSPKTYSGFSTDQLSVTALREDQWKIFKSTGQIVGLSDIEVAKTEVIRTYADPALQQITSMDYSTPNLASALASKRWQVVRPADGLCFVTSDAPAFSFRLHDKGSSLGTGWGLEDTHIGFPLDPEHLFIASPPNQQWVSPVDEANTLAFVGTMAQFSYRNVYAHRDDETIKELVEKHAGTLSFGKDAYVIAS
jgi:Protein of unknown function (DUF4238)